MNTSIWNATSVDVKFPSAQSKISCDVAVVGGGITGITAAYFAMKAGLKAAVMEAWKIGGTTTSFSTGNLYCPVDERLYNIRSKFDRETLRQVVQSRQEGMGIIENIVKEYSIGCDFQKVPWHLFTDAGEDEEVIDKEFNAIEELRLNVSYTENPGVHFKTDKGIVVPEQAQFNPSALFNIKRFKKSKSPKTYCNPTRNNRANRNYCYCLAYPFRPLGKKSYCSAL